MPFYPSRPYGLMVSCGEGLDYKELILSLIKRLVAEDIGVLSLTERRVEVSEIFVVKEDPEFQLTRSSDTSTTYVISARSDVRLIFKERYCRPPTDVVAEDIELALGVKGLVPTAYSTRLGIPSPS